MSVSFLEFLDPTQPQSKQSTIDLWFAFTECLRTLAIKKAIIITIIYVLLKLIALNGFIKGNLRVRAKEQLDTEICLFDNELSL